MDGNKCVENIIIYYNIYQGVAHGPVPGVLDGTVEEGGALSLHRHVVREPGGELRHQLPGPWGRYIGHLNQHL